MADRISSYTKSRMGASQEYSVYLRTQAISYLHKGAKSENTTNKNAGVTLAHKKAKIYINETLKLDIISRVHGHTSVIT